MKKIGKKKEILLLLQKNTVYTWKFAKQSLSLQHHLQSRKGKVSDLIYKKDVFERLSL